MAVLNSDVLARAWLQGSDNFQQRIPNPTIQGYANTVNALFHPMNNDIFNEFSGLLNGLIATYVDIRSWENPLRVLKKSAVEFGHTERHIAVKFLQAHAGKWDDETLLKTERPEFVEWFYSVGEPRRYEFSWSRQELAQAFAQDGYGYDSLLAATIQQMLNSAHSDEMDIMVHMFAEADARIPNGLYRYHIDKVPTNKAEVETLLIGIRSTASRMEIKPTMQYNNIDVPVVEDASTLVLWVTPEMDALIDLAWLANVFQRDVAEIKYRKIVIPEFPVPNVMAALTSEDFIYYRDFMTGMEPPFYNPANRTMKYYYWANGLMGYNPAANCVLFTTDAATQIPTITVKPTALAFDSATYDVAAGGEVQLGINLTGTITGDNPDGIIAVEPDAALYSIATATGTTASLNSATFVDHYGVLHVQKSGLKAGDKLTVTAKSAYINPSAATTTFTATATVTIVDATGNGAKHAFVDDNPYLAGTDDPEGVATLVSDAAEDPDDGSGDGGDGGDEGDN